MHISASLASDFAALSAALDDPDDDIARTVQRLAAGTKAAVGSFTGLSILTVAGEQSFTFTVLEELTEPAHIVTSLKLNLASTDAALAGPTPSVELVLYARTRGAFVDIAADVAWLSSDNVAVLDQHLVPPPRTAPGQGLSDQSVLNQAIGVLIGRGRSPERAHDDIDDAVVKGPLDRQAIAAAILAGLDPLDDLDGTPA